MNSYLHANNSISVLNISGSKINNNCINIINFMKTTGISCHIVENKTIIDNKIQNGCIITVTDIKPHIITEHIWKPLKIKYDLNDAFLEIKNK
jgi:hypothetical protein